MASKAVLALAILCALFVSAHGAVQVQAAAAADPNAPKIRELMEEMNKRSATTLGLFKELAVMVNEYGEVIDKIKTDVDDGAARFVDWMERANVAFKAYQKDMKEAGKKAVWTALKMGLKVLLGGIDIAEPVKKAVELIAEAAFFAGENSGKIIKIVGHPNKEDAKELLKDFFKTAAIVGADEGLKAGLEKIVEESVVSAIPGIGDVIDIYQLIKAAYKAKKSGDKFTNILKLWFKSNKELGQMFKTEIKDSLEFAKSKNLLMQEQVKYINESVDQQMEVLEQIKALRASGAPSGALTPSAAPKKGQF